MANTQGNDKKVTVFVSAAQPKPTVDMEPIRGEKGKWHKISWDIDNASLPNASFVAPYIRIWDSTGMEIFPNDQNLFHKFKHTDKKLSLQNENPKKERYVYYLYLIGAPGGAVEEIKFARRIVRQVLVDGVPREEEEVTEVDPTMDNDGF